MMMDINDLDYVKKTTKEVEMSLGSLFFVLVWTNDSATLPFFLFMNKLSTCAHYLICIFLSILKYASNLSS